MNIEEYLKTNFGLDSFRPHQKDIIQNLLKKNDTIALLPTGAGKSLCYQFPAMMFNGKCLVVSPLVSLMKDQVDGLRKKGMSAVAWYTGSQDSTKNYKGEKFIYIAPEGLRKRFDLLKKIGVSLVAIDECHAISSYGHEFRPSYRQLKILKRLNAPIFACTATATNSTLKDVAEQLDIPYAKKFRASLYRKNLNIDVRIKTSVHKDVIDIFKQKTTKEGLLCGRYANSSIVYCATRRLTEYLCYRLKQASFKAAPYHAGMKHSMRYEVQEKFMKGDVDIVCATIAFGMGIDKKDIRTVVHHSVPGSIEGYYQEIGRAGRDGKESDCILLYDPSDFYVHDFFISRMSGEAQKIMQDKKDAMFEFVESNECYWKTLLEYFNEKPALPNNYNQNCGKCNNCEN